MLCRRYFHVSRLVLQVAQPPHHVPCFRSKHELWLHCGSTSDKADLAGRWVVVRCGVGLVISALFFPHASVHLHFVLFITRLPQRHDDAFMKDRTTSTCYRDAECLLCRKHCHLIPEIYISRLERLFDTQPLSLIHI